ncbi:DUF3305 domain-containing protein [Yoonia sp.]|uniref:DUF3305 domain-containing protein n=1 Tax=Yoonia sp. TaxID=2212373 RepID=UPI003F6B2E11
MPVGVVLQRKQGVTRWAKWAWKAVAVIPGAAQADWMVLREIGDTVEFHAATRPLELHGAECEAYMAGLAAKVPALYVVMRRSDDAQRPFDVLLVTASPFEAQDYTDNGEDIVEKVTMPDGIIGWVRDFTDRFFEEEVFIKRRRDKQRTDRVENGIGDKRIAQLTDVYRAPQRKGSAV